MHIEHQIRGIWEKLEDIEKRLQEVEAAQEEKIESLKAEVLDAESRAS